MTPAFGRYEAAKQEYIAALIELTEATSANDAAKVALTAAQKLKDASDRKEADAKRQQLRTEFADATADRDGAQELLDEFKA